VPTLAGEAAGEVDLTFWRLAALVARALTAPGAINWVGTIASPDGDGESRGETA